LFFIRKSIIIKNHPWSIKSFEDKRAEKRSEQIKAEVFGERNSELDNTKRVKRIARLKRLERIGEDPETNHRYRMWLTKRCNKPAKLLFTIDWTDIPDTKICPLLGVTLIWERSSWSKIPNNAATLDRIDSTKGYVPGNVQVLSFLANRMKSDATKEQLVVFAKNILKLYS
jgi:hypothetical protein